MMTVIGRTKYFDVGVTIGFKSPSNFIESYIY